MDYRTLPRYIDLLFCLVLLPALLLLFPVEHWISRSPVFFLMLVGWLYAVYFTHRFCSIPWLFRKDRLWLGLLLIVLSIAATWLLSEHLFRLMPYGPPKGRIFPGYSPSHRMRVQGVWFLFLVVTAFSFAVGLLTQVFRQMMARRELEAAKNRAELALYRAQINPHFLFNTLNTIYGLVVSRSDRAEEAVVRFSDLLKYLYRNVQEEMPPLREEAAYIRRYAELMQLRTGPEVSLEFRERIEDPRTGFPPMILITFVENAFKHGLAGSGARISVCLEATARELHFRVTNSLPDTAGTGQPEEGIGIANCRRRLDLYYPGHYTLRTGRCGNEYCADLQVRLQHPGSGQIHRTPASL